MTEIYRFAAVTKGLFVNLALQEPFGLTLIEAAAHGLPSVATKNGGPVDIVATLRNGVLVRGAGDECWAPRTLPAALLLSGGPAPSFASGGPDGRPRRWGGDAGPPPRPGAVGEVPRERPRAHHGLLLEGAGAARARRRV